MAASTFPLARNLNPSLRFEIVFVLIRNSHSAMLMISYCQIAGWGSNGTTRGSGIRGDDKRACRPPRRPSCTLVCHLNLNQPPLLVAILPPHLHLLLPLLVIFSTAATSTFLTSHIQNPSCASPRPPSHINHLHHTGEPGHIEC